MINTVFLFFFLGVFINPLGYSKEEPQTRLLIVSINNAHPFYVSLCNIEHNPKTKQVEVSVKVYVDDLEKVMENETKKKLQIATPKESSETNSLVFSYLQKKIRLKVNGKAQELKLLGKEVDSKDQTAIWVYLYAEKVGKVKDIEIRNEVFLDVLPGQSNVTHLKVGSTKQSFNFREGHTVESVKL